MANPKSTVYKCYDFLLFFLGRLSVLLRSFSNFLPGSSNEIKMNFSSSSSGGRPYKINTCEKEFNYFTTYKRHLNLHKGEKPFACEHCDKKFTSLNYLKNHLNTHAKHASQESQTDFKFDDSSSQSQMVVDGQEGLDSMEEETAAQSIQNDKRRLIKQKVMEERTRIRTTRYLRLSPNSTV